MNSRPSPRRRGIPAPLPPPPLSAVHPDPRGVFAGLRRQGKTIEMRDDNERVFSQPRSAAHQGSLQQHGADVEQPEVSSSASFTLPQTQRIL